MTIRKQKRDRTQEGRQLRSQVLKFDKFNLLALMLFKWKQLDFVLAKDCIVSIHDH